MAYKRHTKKQIERLLTVAQVADWLQLKPRTIYQWVHVGYIPAIKLGTLVRFDQVSIKAWVKQREAPGRTRRRLGFEIN
jgi:excisionase family DNA binding protein